MFQEGFLDVMKKEQRKTKTLLHKVIAIYIYIYIFVVSIKFDHNLVLQFCVNFLKLFLFT